MSDGLKKAACANLPKLVRDGVPEIILKEGRWVTSRRATNSIELSALLKDKLKEEMAELLGSWEDNPLPDLDELIDVMEVIETIANLLPGDFRAVKKQKGDAKGRFYSGVVLIDYGDEPGAPSK